MNLQKSRLSPSTRCASGFAGVRSRSSASRRAATVLDWLREDAAGQRAPKRAARRATAAPARSCWRASRRGKLTYEAFNACILLLGQLDGAELITVEDLADGDTLHPVQQAMVDHHGSQCGFCTPGIVMSLFAAYHSGAPATRCEPLRPARRQSLPLHRLSPDPDRGARDLRRRAERSLRGDGRGSAPRRLPRSHDGADLFVGDESQFFAAPASLDSLAALYQRFPDATLVAGATDVGLWITKLLRDLKRVIWLGRVEGLDAIARDRRRRTVDRRRRDARRGDAACSRRSIRTLAS